MMKSALVFLSCFAVSCSTLRQSSEHSYGYFNELAPDKYKLMVYWADTPRDQRLDRAAYELCKEHNLGFSPESMEDYYNAVGGRFGRGGSSYIILNCKGEVDPKLTKIYDASSEKFEATPNHTLFWPTGYSYRFQLAHK